MSDGKNLGEPDFFLVIDVYIYVCALYKADKTPKRPLAHAIEA